MDDRLRGYMLLTIESQKRLINLTNVRLKNDDVIMRELARKEIEGYQSVINHFEYMLVNF